jgi:hypothetical protein|tara:strand:- start:2122 stop:2373 length:252 start_codon:yes stop_codon:yes gene_type:complete
MENADIHPNVWNQLSPVQHLEIMERTEVTIHKDVGQFYTSRRNILTSPVCRNEKNAREYDVMTMRNLKDSAKLFVEQPQKKEN